MIGVASLPVLAAFYALALNLHASQAELMRQETQRIAEESRAYCGKWGFLAGTQKHFACVLDLGEIRRREASRIQDDYVGYPGGH